ncbi:transposase [Bacillota bacterium LX-D]|nr:transposase [Bacillota bacterium LX-D]
MPRTGREKSKSGIYHIVLRGINRQTIFEEEEDSLKYLKTLQDFKEKSGYQIYAYCLMGNHIHLLLKEGQEELGIIMRRIGASYVYWYNWKYGRCGHLFQDRYKSETVEDESYFLTVLRYIHQNPLQAGIVKDFATYKWSSYSEYLKESTVLDTDFALDLFSNDRKTAVERFKAFHLASNNDHCLDIEEYRKLTDNEAIEIIKRISNVRHCTEVQTLDKNKRNSFLIAFKNAGLSTRQIARLTGISRGVILKV